MHETSSVPAYSRPIEESGKEILELYENEIIDRRGIGNGSH
jgi:hypothetical protein